MTFAAIGYLFGYDGSFDFKGGDSTYENTGVPFVEMRAVSAVCGSLTAIIVYCMFIDMKYSLPIAIMGSCLIIFDNYLTTMSRYILLDPQMVFYIVAACYSWVKFRCHAQNPFSLLWWVWLTATGLFLACTLSVKLVGLSIIAVIGLCTLRDLLDLSKASKTSKLSTVSYYWLARVICLIILPLVIFFGFYWVHFRVLNYNHANGGESFMSERFRKSLIDKSLIKIKPVFYGSTIKLKNTDQESYLHSQTFRSHGQKVTVSNVTDKHNDWTIHPAFVDVSVERGNNNAPVLYVVKHGDFVRLRHASSGKYLATSNVTNVTSNSTATEVTLITVENATSKRYNETFWIVIVQNGSQQLGANHSVFVLFHPETGNTLRTSHETSPDWELEQFEVNAANVVNFSNTTGVKWLIESCKAPHGWEVSDVVNIDEPDPIEVGFYDKFVELIQVALEINAGFSSDTPEHLPPTKWPFMDHPMVW
eukprot:CAMPEP_0176447034 /NCGR_PEP_ID=MMETSP0127-20121128/24743_1 /TAXON_ID=938130 /ORGANISM="Platyophrya macrostoma, Strain WH" /LENGTH=476 /DNA_ID=CAMNT_0017833307 /DNA_START=275 /DNA_END=1702 /DNA_ORIENTATION=+